MKLIIALFIFVISLMELQAQEIREQQQFRGSVEVIATSSPQTVKGAPFSAEAVSESVQILADGNKLTRSATTRMYRDGEGRVRREQAPNTGTSIGVPIDGQQAISISDPVAGVRFVLYPSSKTVHRSAIKSVNFETTVKTNRNSLSANLPQTESLGVREIEGVKAVGTRTTTNIPVGEVGNERAFQIVYERWYSEELQEIVLSKHTDPRFGVQTYRLTNVKRGEPDRRLFTLPADYKITDSKAFTYQVNRTL